MSTNSGKRSQGNRTYPTNNFPAGYVQLTTTIASAAVGFTAGQLPDGAIMCIMQAEAQSVRWRDDGVAPTATVGMMITAGSTFIYTGDLTKIQFIAATTGSILNASFYT